MNTENCGAVLRGVFFLIAMSFLLHTLLGLASQASQGSTGKINSEGVAAGTGSGPVPPIDLAAPTTHKTATFGLG